MYQEFSVVTFIELTILYSQQKCRFHTVVGSSGTGDSSKQLDQGGVIR